MTALFEKKKEIFGNHEKHHFQMTLKELANETITFDMLNRQKEMESQQILNEIKIYFISFFDKINLITIK